MQAILALEDGRIFRGQGYGHPGECRARLFLILLLPDIRKSQPIPPMPVKSSFSQIPKSGTTAPTRQTTSRPAFYRGTDRPRVLGRQFQLALRAGHR